jgi:threonyl-tRNA synthetase
VLGEQLELFTFSEEAPGFPFFLPKGAMLFNLLQSYMRDLLQRRDYLEVKTPLILSERMWHTSGHYANYMENMFFTKLKLRDEKQPETIHDNVEEERPMAVKPMNCPGHLVVYRSKQHSHNEFPLRIAEMGLVHRREMSGVRHGLFRVQAFTQDDAHHFCTTEQIEDEIKMLIDFFDEVYHAFDLSDVRIELSTRPEKSIGSDEMWQQAEAAQSCVGQKGHRLSAQRRRRRVLWAQDRLSHSRRAQALVAMRNDSARLFDARALWADLHRRRRSETHTGDDSRACYGSLERFLGIIIENYAAKFPMWLAPLQVQVLPVSEKFNAYAREVNSHLLDAGLRSEANLRDDRIGYKIRVASLQKIPLRAGGRRKGTVQSIDQRAHA